MWCHSTLRDLSPGNLASNMRCNNITRMLTDPNWHVKEQLQPLCDPIHRALEFASSRERELRADIGLAGQEYGYLGTHMARALAHQWLVSHTDELGEWCLTGDHSRNGELWLRYGMTRIRVLHTRSKSDVPEAGPNKARQLYFRNPRVDNMPEQQALETLEASKLLGLWRAHPETGDVTVRVVRTVRARRVNGWVPVDVHFSLPRAADDLADAEWIPDDSGIQFNDDLGEDQDDAGGFLG